MTISSIRITKKEKYMYFEATIKQEVEGKNNKFKLLIENASTFSEAEYKSLDYVGGKGDVVALKLMKRLMEIINTKRNEEEALYYANIESIFVDDNGKEKATKYVVGVYAKDIETATDRASEYMKEGLSDMQFMGIKLAKVENVI